MTLAKRPAAQRTRPQYYRQPNTTSIPHGYTTTVYADLPYGGRLTCGPSQTWTQQPCQLMQNIVQGRGSADAGRSPAIGRLSDGE